MTKNELEVIGIRCVRQTKPLFSDISFTLNTGEMILVEGANGAGKSSLLRLIASLATPSCGRIEWQGKSILKIVCDYRKNLHYLGHQNGVKLRLTVSENLQLLNSLHENESFTNYDETLSLLQLNSHQDTPTYYLSAGQRRRLALAKLFLISKPLWILDEPLTALDTHSQQLFLSQLTLHLQNGGMAIISSHHPIHFETAAVKTLRLNAC